MRSKRFRASSSRKVGTRAKKKKGMTRMTAFFCSRSTFRAITRLQTLATQAKIEEALSQSGHVIFSRSRDA